MALDGLGTRRHHRSAIIVEETRIPPKAGPDRGDVILQEDSLPDLIGDWQRLKFIPAKTPESLTVGVYWWVHQWIYGRNNQNAIVSFDQLGEDQWHELTYCYRTQDWVIVQRDVYEDLEQGGQYIAVKMHREDGELAVLVFSVFFEDGQWAVPPTVNLSRMNEFNPANPRLGDRMRGRVDPISSFAEPVSGHDRALQCQVLISCNETNFAETLDSAVHLHLESRLRFRAGWLKHADSLKRR